MHLKALPSSLSLPLEVKTGGVSNQLNSREGCSDRAEDKVKGLEVKVLLPKEALSQKVIKKAISQQASSWNTCEIKLEHRTSES